jgi:hypothetical protein
MNNERESRAGAEHGRGRGGAVQGTAPAGAAVNATLTTVLVRGHAVAVERVDTHRWRVTVDGRTFASFCSVSRARAAGKAEARRLEFVALESRGRPSSE